MRTHERQIKTVGSRQCRFTPLPVLKAAKLQADLVPRVMPVIMRISAVADEVKGIEDVAEIVKKIPKDDLGEVAQQVLASLPADYFEELCNQLLPSCEVKAPEGTQWIAMEAAGGFDFLEKPHHVFVWLMAALEVQLADFFELFTSTEGS